MTLVVREGQGEVIEERTNPVALRSSGERCWWKMRELGDIHKKGKGKDTRKNETRNREEKGQGGEMKRGKGGRERGRGRKEGGVHTCCMLDAKLRKPARS